MSVSTTSIAQAVGARHMPAERLFQPMRLGRNHLPHRIVMAPLTRSCTPLNADDPSIYYGGGARGYTDYPALAQERGEQPQSCLDDRWR
jgi:hypothetical protein